MCSAVAPAAASNTEQQRYSMFSCSLDCFFFGGIGV
jgi:hypothetical protein